MKYSVTAERKVFCVWAQEVYILLVWALKLGIELTSNYNIINWWECGCWPDVITGQELPRTSFLASMNKLWPERFVWLAAGRSQALVVWQWIWHSGIIWWFWEAWTTVISHEGVEWLIVNRRLVGNFYQVTQWFVRTRPRGHYMRHTYRPWDTIQYVNVTSTLEQRWIFHVLIYGILSRLMHYHKSLNGCWSLPGCLDLTKTKH